MSEQRHKVGALTIAPGPQGYLTSILLDDPPAPTQEMLTPDTTLTAGTEPVTVLELVTWALKQEVLYVRLTRERLRYDTITRADFMGPGA